MCKYVYNRFCLLFIYKSNFIDYFKRKKNLGRSKTIFLYKYYLPKLCLYLKGKSKKRSNEKDSILNALFN